MLKLLYDVIENNDLFYSKNQDTIICEYMEVLARVLLHNKPFFMKLFQQLQRDDSSGNNLLLRLINVWLNQVSNLFSKFILPLTTNVVNSVMEYIHYINVRQFYWRFQNSCRAMNQVFCNKSVPSLITLYLFYMSFWTHQLSQI